MESANMEDFRGKRKETREWRPFSEARAFVHTLGFKNMAQWQAYGKAGKRPYDIPGNPDKVYITEFKGYGDWLGTFNIAPTKRGFRTFKEARSYVHSLKLKNQDEWLAYCRSGQKPVDIPATPNNVYLGEFDGFGDWLGTGRTR